MISNGNINENDWDYICSNIANCKAGASVYKEDVKAAHQNLRSNRFWTIANSYGISNVVESLLK